MRQDKTKAFKEETKETEGILRLFSIWYQQVFSIMKSI